MLPHIQRPRRLRASATMRRLVRETTLSVDDLIAPLFVAEGDDTREEIGAMPGQYRLGIRALVDTCLRLRDAGIPGVALFPAIPDALKRPDAAEALNTDGLYPRAIRAVKQQVPDLLVVTDPALDPYSSDGHDGLVHHGRIANDPTVEMLAQVALLQAQAGADVVAPSDMMDGRVAAIRDALDSGGFEDVAILSYTAKYASAYYGPFREALDSAPRARSGVPADKKTYQMDPANADEAIRELYLDLQEGADMVMVKPALNYLDVIHVLREHSTVPVAGYHVSGEYAMVKAAAAQGWLDERAAAIEAVSAIKRAGASIVLTYFAESLANWLTGRTA